MPPSKSLPRPTLSIPASRTAWSIWLMRWCRVAYLLAEMRRAALCSASSCVSSDARSLDRFSFRGNGMYSCRASGCRKGAWAAIQMSPPLAAMSSINRSDRLRGLSHRVWQHECEAMTGCSENLSTCCTVSSVECETSINSPSEFILLIAWRPWVERPLWTGVSVDESASQFAVMCVRPTLEIPASRSWSSMFKSPSSASQPSRERNMLIDSARMASSASGTFDVIWKWILLEQNCRAVVRRSKVRARDTAGG